MIFRTSKTGPYRLFKLLWRANIPFASRHQHLIHFNRIPGSKHSSKTDNSIEVDQLRIRAQFLPLYTSGILGGCPESNSEVSECKEVSWEIPVVPSFHIHDFGWKARGAATGEICRAGTALLSTRWRQKSWQDIFVGLQWRLSTLHPSIRNTRAKSQVAQGRTSLEAQKCLVENEQINKYAYTLRLIYWKLLVIFQYSEKIQ